jgi:hypothetical protein
MKVAGYGSPMRLACCAVFGSLFVPASLLLELAMPRHNHLSLAATLWPHPWLMLLYYGPLVSGFAITVWSISRLTTGVKKNVWTEGELAPLRRRLELPIWIWLYLGAVAILIGVVAWRGHAGVFLLMLFPFQMLMGMLGLFKPQTATATGLLSGRMLTPIRSEHWGNTSDHGSPH